MSAPQFYETSALLTSQGTTEWLWVMTSPPTIPLPVDEWPLFAGQEQDITGEPRESVVGAYEQLIGEASRVYPIQPDRLGEAVQMLIETSDRPRRSALAKFRYWFGPEDAKEPLRRAREARWRRDRDRFEEFVEDRERYTDYDRLEVAPDDSALYVTTPEDEITWQALTFDLVPLEASPLSKTSIAKVASGGATLAICFFTGGPVLLIVGASVGLIAIRAVGSALWEGAKPEVADFGGDATAHLLDAIRAKLGIKRRKR